MIKLVLILELILFIIIITAALSSVLGFSVLSNRLLAVIVYAGGRAIAGLMLFDLLRTDPSAD